MAHPALVDHSDRDRVDRIDTPTALFASDNECRLTQHVQMFHHGEARQAGKTLDDFRRRARPVRNMSRMPRRVSSESAFQIWSRPSDMVNRWRGFKGLCRYFFAPDSAPL